jgi:hypothetical protein
MRVLRQNTKDKSKKLSNSLPRFIGEVTKSRKAGTKVKRYIRNQEFPADLTYFRRFCSFYLRQSAISAGKNVLQRNLCDVIRGEIIEDSITLENNYNKLLYEKNINLNIINDCYNDLYQ